MTIELPGDLYFTYQDDIVASSEVWVDSISNTGVTYTLDGNDQLTGTSFYLDSYKASGGAGFFNNNASTIDTGNGSDVITGKSATRTVYLDGDWYNPLGGDYIHYSYPAYTYYGYGIDNRGTIETGDDGDYLNSYGTFYNSGTVSLGSGNDGLYVIVSAEEARGRTLLNYGTIEAGNGDDYLNSYGTFYNSGTVSLGSGNDSITINLESPFSDGLRNYQTIETQDGDDLIFSAGAIYNEGIIHTGNGKDSLTADGDFYGSGNVFLGNGEDYLKGFGSGYYEGGNDQDSLELTSGSYTIGISGAVVSFIKSGYSKTMLTFGFEKLIAGSTTHDFTGLSDEQTIFVP